MTWTDGKPFVATEWHLKADWNCVKNGEHFRCALCGHRFELGETVRWQFTNDVPGAGGNPFLCKGCDNDKDAIVATIIGRRDELKQDRWWWFLSRKGIT